MGTTVVDFTTDVSKKLELVFWQLRQQQRISRRMMIGAEKLAAGVQRELGENAFPFELLVNYLTNAELGGASDRELLDRLAIFGFLTKRE